MGLDVPRTVAPFLVADQKTEIEPDLAKVSESSVAQLDQCTLPTYPVK